MYNWARVTVSPEKAGDSMFPSRTEFIVCVLVSACAGSTAPTQAQERGRRDDGRSQRHRARREQPPEPKEREVPWRLEQDFLGPYPDWLWDRPRHWAPYRYRYPTRPWHGSRFRGYSRDYPHGYRTPPVWDPYGYESERAYWRALKIARDLERFETRQEQGLAAYLDAMDAGHRAFANAQYRSAALHFLRAATSNQGDPAARICAAHAQVALGRYDSAVRLIRRAFELQPKLAYLPMDVRTAYGNRTDFADHLAALSAAAKKNAENGDLWLLLGYYYYFSDNVANAARALTRAVQLEPEDRLPARLLDLAGTIEPPARPMHPVKKQRRTELKDL